MKIERVAMESELIDNMLTENFTSLLSREQHYKKHVISQELWGPKHMSIDEYQARAEKLAREKVDGKTIFGYESLSKDNRPAYCKWRKPKEGSTGDFVLYFYRDGDTEPTILSLFTKTWGQYTGDKAIGYNDEIPAGK